MDLLTVVVSALLVDDTSSRPNRALLSKRRSSRPQAGPPLQICILERGIQFSAPKVRLWLQKHVFAFKATSSSIAASMHRVQTAPSRPKSHLCISRHLDRFKSTSSNTVPRSLLPRRISAFKGASSTTVPRPCVQRHVFGSNFTFFWLQRRILRLSAASSPSKLHSPLQRRTPSTHVASSSPTPPDRPQCFAFVFKRAYYPPNARRWSSRRVHGPNAASTRLVLCPRV